MKKKMKIQISQNHFITLQTRGVSVNVKSKAEEAAVEMGFSSLQDAVRLFVRQLADRKINLELDLAYEDYSKGNYIDIKPGEDIRRKLLER